MKLKAMKAAGLGVFQEIELPIEELSDVDRVVVFAGDNGEGKTMALELAMLGAPHRWTPGRGALHVLANDKNSFVESKIELDEVYTCRVTVDGASKIPKSSAYLIGENGKELNDGKISTYDAVIAERFPPKDLTLAGPFASQKGEGRFLSLKGAKRKALFIRMLGQGRLETLAEAAGVKATGVKAEVVKVNGGIEAVEGSVRCLDDLQEDQRKAVVAVGEAAQQVTELEAQRAEAEAELERWNAENADLIKVRGRAVAALGEETTKKSTLEKMREGLQIRIRNIVGALLRAKEKTSKEPDLRSKLDGLKTAEDVETLRLELDRQRDLAAKAEGLREKWREATAGVTKATMLWERDLHMARGDAANTRHLWEQAEGRSGKLQTVRETCAGDFSGCALATDAVHSLDSLDALRADMEKAEEKASGSEEPEALTSLRLKVSALVTQGKELQADPRAVKKIETRIDAAGKLVTERDRLKAELASLAAYAEQVIQLTRELATVEAEAEEKAKQVKATEGVIDEAGKRVTECEAEGDKHESRRPAPIHTAKLNEAREGQRLIAAEVEGIRARIATAEESLEKMAVLKAKLAGLSVELDDWQHLQKALGANGVQALEIDAAGPEVSSSANELLHAGYGPRFSVSLETTQAMARGKGTKEIFDLRVIDTERGTDGPAEHLSGGEQVLVEEALGLAVAVYNMRRSEISGCDLVRDEMAGALSAPRAVRYVAMLRRALKLGDFGRVYFVTHQPELWSLADKRVWFRDGKATLAETSEILEGMRCE